MAVTWGHASGLRDAMACVPLVAVGAVSDRRARLWLRSRAAGPFIVAIGARGGEVRTALVPDRRGVGQDGTMAFTLPDDIPTVGSLMPATAYEFQITVARTGELVGKGQFETAPVAGSPGRLAFAVMSCHQPFKPDGSLHPDSVLMLAALEPALDARGVKYALLLGGQIYEDAPHPHSLLRRNRQPPLLEASVAEIRAYYQARYRESWALPAVRRFLARLPTWCIWDDHEIVNDWGSTPVHQSPAWRRIFEGARLAFIDYQVSRTMNAGESWPPAFHQAFTWGSTATFLMDLSSQRAVRADTAEVYGADQLEALTEFLREHRTYPVVFIVLSVPLAFLPDWVVALGERLPGQGALFATRWNARRNHQARDQLLDVLWAHQRATPGQKLVLLSGDVHQGAAIALRWPDGAQAYQFVSSPVTNALRTWKERIAQRLSFTMPHLQHREASVTIERLRGTDPRQRNPFNELNVGVVSFEGGEASANVRFELITHDAEVPGAARVAYDSGWL